MTVEAEFDDDAPVLVEQTDAVRWVRLNRPHRRNALTPRLVAALDRAVADAVADDSTAVVVITGAGLSFCAGADLRYLRQAAMTGTDPLEFLARVSNCFTRIEQAPKPIVAALHGHVVAGGLELALACDVVVAQAGTLIGDGHVNNGLLPGGGASVRLPRKVGEPLARWLMLTGELLPAEAFVPSGLVHTVADPDYFEVVVADLAGRLSVGGTAAHSRIKQLLGHWHDLDTAEALARELDVLAEHWQHTDVAGALTRFVEKSRG